MAYDRCQVGVVTRLDPQALLPDHYIDDPDHLYNVLRTQIDLVLPTGVGVLNADDERVAEMAELCDGEVIFFARASDAPPLVTHLGSGARAVFVSAGQLVLAQGANRTGLAALAAIPMAGANPTAAALTALLAAVAAAWGLGIAPELIRAGIETFTPEQTN
jgi:cyanophycin synthetase